MIIALRKITRRPVEVLTLLVALGLPCSAPAIDASRPPRAAGRLIVRERVGLSIDALQTTLQHHGARRLGGVGPLDATLVEVPESELPAAEVGLRRSGLFKSVERDYLSHVAESPNDPDFAEQWSLPRCGVPAAWDLSTGAGVVVAVIDTGIDASHPDLQGQVLPGYDFVNDDADPTDDDGHGTRMSGIIAAHRNNGLGIAGIAPDALLLPVKVLDAQGAGAYSTVANGITYAVDHGARVLSLSLTGPVQSDLLQAAVDYATAHDAVVVAAAGNDGATAPAYPAAAAGAVAVSATDENDQRATFSNYGAWISIAAPGVDIVTTSLAATYASSSGTSPAAAFGSGVFALLFAADPTVSRSDAIDRVQQGSADLGSRGWDRYYGWGRVDAYGALVPGQSGSTPPDTLAPDVAILSPATNSLLWGMVPVDVAAHDNVAIGRVELFLDNQWYATATSAPYQFIIDSTQIEPGTHKLRADAYDTSENFARSKSRRISFTPGSGLLVGHAIVKSTTVTISAELALPQGVAFDASRDRLLVSLTSASGTILSATAQAGTLAGSADGRMQGMIAPVVPPVGRVRLTAVANPGQSIYRLKIRASRLDGMNNLQPLMNLAVQIGSVQLSQSLPCRGRASSLIYP